MQQVDDPARLCSTLGLFPSPGTSCLHAADVAKKKKIKEKNYIAYFVHAFASKIPLWCQILDFWFYFLIFQTFHKIFVASYVQMFNKI